MVCDSANFPQTGKHSTVNNARNQDAFQESQRRTPGFMLHFSQRQGVFLPIGLVQVSLGVIGAPKAPKVKRGKVPVPDRHLF